VARVVLAAPVVMEAHQAQLLLVVQLARVVQLVRVEFYIQGDSSALITEQSNFLHMLRQM